MAAASSDPLGFVTSDVSCWRKDQHEFQKAISDLAGIDIKRHKNKPPEIVRAVRDWFVEPWAYAAFTALPGSGIDLQILLQISMTRASLMGSLTKI